MAHSNTVETNIQQPTTKTKSSNNNNTVLIAGKSRIKDEDGFIGTVAYIGAVASAKNPNEIYAGIKWDDSTRGKHNGSVIDRNTQKLVHHFTCNSPTGGSFLKIHKVQHGVELNESLLKSKYVEMDAGLIAPNNILPHFVTTCRGKEKKPIEFIGELKIRGQQQMDCMSSISLRCLGISCISSNFCSSSFLEHLKSIDLAGNLLCQWRDVILMLKQFENLERLSLASNKILDIGKEDEEYEVIVFKNMKVLNLNNCGITSHLTLTEINQMTPNLLELCVASNPIGESLEQIPSSATVPFFSNLTLLDCSNCNITSWETQVKLFSSLPKLATLILDDNSIPVITPPPTPQQDFFTSLQSLQLAGNDIKSWIDLDALAHIPTLTSLRFRNNPISETMGTGEARSIVIARLPNITYVNASPVTEKERMESERRYVYAIIRDVLTQNTTSTTQENKETIIHQSLSEISKSHPRFELLFQEHHDSMLSLLHQNKNQLLCQSGSLGQDAMNVTIQSMLPANCSNNTLVKRLPATLSIGRLKILCGRVFDVNVEDLVLHFKANANDPFPVELDDDKNSLEYYGIYNGAEILVNEKEISA